KYFRAESPVLMLALPFHKRPSLTGNTILMNRSSDSTNSAWSAVRVAYSTLWCLQVVSGQFLISVSIRKEGLFRLSVKVSATRYIIWQVFLKSTQRASSHIEETTT